jgi:hypothetical protein
MSDKNLVDKTIDSKLSKLVPDFIARNAEAIKSMNNKNFQLLDYGCYIL